MHVPLSHGSFLRRAGAAAAQIAARKADQTNGRGGWKSAGPDKDGAARGGGVGAGAFHTRFLGSDRTS